MGVDFTCDTKTFGCSYSGWHYFRNLIIGATLAYLDDFLSKQKYEEDTYEFSAMNNLKKGVASIRSTAVKISSENKTIFGMDLGKRPVEECLLKALAIEINSNSWFGELLIEYGLGGIWALCNKSDCEGFYSVGNAYDICDLFSLIRDFTLENNFDIDAPENIIYRSIHQIERVFQESLKKKRIVSIF